MDASSARIRSVPVAVLLAVVFGATSLRGGEATPTVRLPADVTYSGGEGSPGAVVFSHATHVPLADGKCVACHPGAFSILRPAGRITHQEMNAGHKCGVCHDGTKAGGIQDDCTHCHRLGDAP